MKHWAPVAQLSVAAVMFFCSEYCTNSQTRQFASCIMFTDAGMVNKGEYSQGCQSYDLFAYGILILFKSDCINPVFAFPLVLLFHIIGTFSFNYPDVLSCACLLCVPPKGGGRPFCPSLNPPLKHSVYEAVTHTCIINVYIMFVAACLLDLNFVIDSSASIKGKDPGNWDKTLQFVANVVLQFTIGPNNVQVAFVLFSDVATVEWGLTRYNDSASLIDAILNVRYINSTTNLNDALYLTRTQVYAPGRGTRPNAVKVTVILTDGVDNVPEPGTPLTLANATLCKSEGIRLMAIGVSDDVDNDRLLQIVSSPFYYHIVDDFDSLTSVIDQLQPREFCVLPFVPGTGHCFLFNIFFVSDRCLVASSFSNTEHVYSIG